MNKLQSGATPILAAFVIVACNTRALSQEVPSDPAFEVADRYSAAADTAGELARELIRAEGLPGVSVAVGVDGEIVWAEGFGWADLESEVPVTPETRFRVGSTAKPMTALAAVRLHESGRLDLDAAVRTLVPEFPGKRWPVTVRQLLGHVGGIRHYVDIENEVLRSVPCDDVRDRLAVFAEDTLIATPGAQYNYSTYGYVLVSAAVAAAAGEAFFPFMQRTVFDPLRMTGTAPASGTVELSDRARPYAAGRRPAPEREESCILGGGGLVSTPSDLVRFGMALLDDTLVSPATREVLWTAGTDGSGEDTGYGLGWFVRSIRLPGDTASSRLLGHGGRSIGGTGSLMVFPEHGIVVSSTTNMSQAEDLPAVGARIAALFRTVSPPPREPVYP